MIQIETSSPDWLIADILDNCPDAPVSSIRRCITKAVRDLSRAGLVEPWINVPTQANVPDYPLDHLIPEGFRIKYLRLVEWCGTCICPIPDCTPCPTGYTYDDMHHITLHGGYLPCEDSQSDLRIKVALDVVNDSCSIPRDMLEMFETDLMVGAMAHLLGQKNKVWSDSRESEKLHAMYAGCISSAKQLRRQGMTDGTTRILPECLI